MKMFIIVLLEAGFLITGFHCVLYKQVRAALPSALLSAIPPQSTVETGRKWDVFDHLFLRFTAWKPGFGY